MVILTIHIKPSLSALGQPLQMAAHASDLGDSLNQCRMGGKWITMAMMFVGGLRWCSMEFPHNSYCWKPMGREFFIPTRTQIRVKLLTRKDQSYDWLHPHEGNLCTKKTTSNIIKSIIDFFHPFKSWIFAKIRWRFRSGTAGGGTISWPLTNGENLPTHFLILVYGRLSFLFVLSARSTLHVQCNT